MNRNAKLLIAAAMCTLAVACTKKVKDVPPPAQVAVAPLAMAYHRPCDSSGLLRPLYLLCHLSSLLSSARFFQRPPAC